MSGWWEVKGKFVLQRSNITPCYLESANIVDDSSIAVKANVPSTHRKRQLGAGERRAFGGAGSWAEEWLT